MKKVFVAHEAEDWGYMGWMPQDAGEPFSPLSYPLGLAHDVFEHHAFNSVSDEIEAHAAMYWLRCEGGMCPRVEGRYLDPLTIKAIAIEWPSLIRGLHESDWYLPACEPQEALGEEIEEDICEIIRLGTFYAIQEDEGELAAYIALVFSDLFRKGYRWAQAEYGENSRDKVQTAFQDVIDWFENRNKQEIIEGTEVSIKYNKDTGKLEIEEMEECWTCGHRFPVEEVTCEDCTVADAE